MKKNKQNIYLSSINQQISSLILLSNLKLNGKTPYIFCIILIIIIVRSYFTFYASSTSFSLPLHFLLTKVNKLCSSSNYTKDSKILSVDPILLNLSFSTNHIYHHHGITYDYYSIPDLQQSEAGCQWKSWSLLHDTNQNDSVNYIETSPVVISKLPFVDVIYVLTDRSLTDRHNNLKKAFHQQGISLESIKWRMKWNYTTCNSDLNHAYVYQRLNLKDKPLDKEQQRKCALAMKHADVWYEMAETKVRLGLILEDDAIFVPFFKEKFTRMINAAIEKRILRLNDTCIKPKDKPISNNEWINQNPMIVIGACFNFHGQGFQSHLINAPPMFSTHKSNPSRCTHAYLLTLCSAQALVDQIHAQKNDFLPSDFMQNYLFRLSSTLQSFWIDPPLSYQGNQVIDLDNIQTFKSTTYK